MNTLVYKTHIGLGYTHGLADTHWPKGNKLAHRTHTGPEETQWPRGHTLAKRIQPGLVDTNWLLGHPQA